MLSYMIFVATSFVQDSIGFDSSHLVTYSLGVILYLAHVLLLGFGNGSTKSIAQISKVKLRFMDIRGMSCCFKGFPNL